ncbi:MAG TPA: glycosyltransferase family 2 protein [Thermoanaerobaculia bacterium]|nr:glycosyltransferase family 2 protein [Thermoanaerobaculia bacterium]
MPDVDCVVVNRDGGDALFRALSSLEAQTGVDLSVVVVDNASSAEERSRLAREAPAARVVPLSANRGFAGAANEGIAHGRAPFVLLVNNDAVLAPDYAARLAARLSLDGRIAAAQGLVLTADGLRVDSAGLTWNDRGEALPALAGSEPSRAPGGPFEISGVSATAALYRREALASVAPAGDVFDRAFFAYYEDVDLSLRLARGGWRFVCEPGAVARHEGSRTGRRTPLRRALWTCRNRWRTLFRNFDGRWLAGRLGGLLKADLAHARRLGWRGVLLPLLVWPALPVLAWRTRPAGGLLFDWPSAPPSGMRAQG